MITIVPALAGVGRQMGWDRRKHQGGIEWGWVVWLVGRRIGGVVWWMCVVG